MKYSWNKKLNVASKIPSNPSPANRFARSERKEGSSDGSRAGLIDEESTGADAVSGSDGREMVDELRRMGRNSAGPTGLLARRGGGGGRR